MEENNIALTEEQLAEYGYQDLTIQSMQETREINFTDDMTWNDFKAILKEAKMFISLDKDVMEKIDKRFLK